MCRDVLVREFSYKYKGQSQTLREMNGRLTMQPEDLAVFAEICLAQSEVPLAKEDSITLILEENGHSWVYEANSETQSLTNPQGQTEYISLPELLALKWGVTTKVQMQNLLVGNALEATASGQAQLKKAQELQAEGTALLAESDQGLSATDSLAELVNRIGEIQKESVLITAARRVLWVQVCRVQEQLEKFSAAVKSITGSVVKPELIAEISEARETIDAASTRIEQIEEELANLEPIMKWRYAFWWGLGVGVLSIVGYIALRALLSLYDGWVSYLLILGILLVGSAATGLFGKQNQVDTYFSLHDELLDLKTTRRREQKRLKQVLGGQKEEELLEKVKAQHEAELIRAELEYEYDRYSRAWQGRSLKEVQARLKDAQEDLYFLLREPELLDLRNRWQGYWQKRLGFLTQLEPISSKELFWQELAPEGPTDESKTLTSFIVPASAPEIFIVNP